MLRNETNLHLTPGRETEHLYQLSAGAKVSVLKRATAEKQPGAAPRRKSAKDFGGKASSGPVLEDWWLVRDAAEPRGLGAGPHGGSGRPARGGAICRRPALCRFLCVESGAGCGQRGHRTRNVSQYLCAITEPHDGLPYDYDQIRVFTWNVRKHRYETAYREHGLNGVLPVTVTSENFDKEGTLPVFILRVKDDAGNVSERKYKLNTPIVRRVLAPGEQKQAPKPPTQASAAPRRLESS